MSNNVIPEMTTLPVTIVIPVRNEIASMASLLRSIQTQSTSPTAVIVVDAGSSDGTRDVLQQWQDVWPLLSVIEVDQAYPGVGRNLGTAAATTNWVVYIDGGTLPHQNWLQALWQGIQDKGMAAGYGFYKPTLTTTLARWFALSILPGARPVGPGLMRNHFIACSIIRKDAWRQVGGFPPWRAAEDRLFMQSINPLGYVEIPEAIIDWTGPQTWSQLWKRTALLAEHGARAHRARDWHWPTLRYWLIALSVCILAPMAWSIPLIGGAWLLRTGRRIQRHRHEPELCHPTIRDWLGCTMVLLVVDIAMYVGWWRSLVHDDPQLAASAHVR